MTCLPIDGPAGFFMRNSWSVEPLVKNYHVIPEPEKIDSTAFVAANATITGDVTVGRDCSIWFGTVIRGDTQAIEIQEGTNVQDLALLHADAGVPCRLGKNVTVGHAAIVHGAIVEDDCLIGIRATLLNGVHVGRGSLIAAGSLVTEGTQIPPNSVVMGAPARVKREVTPRDRERIEYAARHYREMKDAYRQAGDG